MASTGSEGFSDRSAPRGHGPAADTGQDKDYDRQRLLFCVAAVSPSHGFRKREVQEARNKDSFVELGMDSLSPWSKLKETLATIGEKVEGAVGVTPEHKAKVKADIAEFNTMVDELKATEGYKTSSVVLSKTIAQIQEKLVEASPEVKAKLSALLEELQAQLKKLQESERYQEVREGLSQNLNEIADSIGEAWVEGGGLTSEDLGYVSENLRNMQARLEDLKGTETAATLSKIIDELREKLKEASPEIKAKLEGGIARDQGEDESRNRETSPKIIDELREKLKEASPVIKAKLETEATLSKIIDELRE